MDITSYLLGKNSSSGGGGSISDYFTATISGGSNSGDGIAHMIKKIPENTIVSGKSLESAFRYCVNLVEIPLLDTSSVTSMYYCFAVCSNLTKIPLLNTQNVTTMQRMFWNCNSLVTVPVLSTAKVTTMNDMFVNCSSLSNESLNNILQMCINATRYSQTKKLSSIGLSSAQATICQGLSNYQAFIDAGWTTGY